MDLIEAIGEGALRFSVFAVVFLAMALAEMAAPRRALGHGRRRRWFTNLGIVAIDAVAVRLIFPLAAVGIALWAQVQGYGLFHWIEAPLWLAGPVAFVALDFAVWAQHWVTHKVPVLWRIHRVHHSDVDFDFTTGIRFHPIEIALSMLWKMAVILALGAPAVAVFAFEVVLNGMAMFNHANLRLPPGLDRALRLVIVTPDMHRVHHSAIRRETDANYGFNLSWWDRLFATYVPQPEAGHDGMTIGLKSYQSDAPTRLGWALILPFRRNDRRGRAQ